jgi:hypothetical protein
MALQLDFSTRCRQMHDEIHGPAALSPRKKPAIPICYDAGFIPVPKWRRREKLLLLLDTEPGPSSLKPSHYID